MVWEFIYGIYEFLIEFYNACESLWNWSFEIGSYTIEFKTILTTSLILIIGLLLVKKLIPVA